VLQRVPARVLIALVLVPVIGLGVLSTYRYPVWSPIDEGSHYDYVRVVAEQHRLPQLTDLASDEMLAIGDGTFPGPPKVAPEQAGLAGRIYEAFQPPLYYAVAAPVFRLGGNYRHKAEALRLFGLALFVAALLLFAMLCRDVVRDRWREAFVFGAIFFVLPGNVIRAVTVGNEALDLPLGVLAVFALWRALDRDSDRWSLVAAITIGAGVLTKLTFAAFVPVLAAVLFARWWRSQSRVDAAKFAAVVAVPLLMLTPWLFWNHHTYGSWTANDQAREMQMPIMNPNHDDYGPNKVVNETHLALDATIAQDWHGVGNQDIPTYVKWSLLVAVYLLPVVFLTTARSESRDRRRLLVLGTPLVASFVLISYITVVENWGVMIFRYLRPAMPAWFLLAFLAWDGAMRSPAVTRRLALLSFIGVGAVWWADWRGYLSK
jgi:4-amino-4-deoxy-L-arabinose transferase-like glycosyltransferase